jgi:HTH-type transcriptional regulator / antitoxin HigA
MSILNPNHLSNCFCIESADAGGTLAVWALRTEDDYRRAVESEDRLAVKDEDALTDAERDQLEIFAALIEAYENTHHAIIPPELSPVDFLKKLMDESGISPSTLGRLLGDRSLGYRILSGERSLSKRHVKVLSDYFKIDPSVFLA